MALTGIELASSVLITTVSPVDVKYGPFEGSGIAAARTLALSEVTSNFRYKGLTVGLVDTTNSGTTVVEYWFESGILDANLVLKSSGTTVVANPASTTSTLSSITIGSVNYAIAGGTVGGSGTVSKVPYWSATTVLSDSPITRESANSVSVLYDLQVKGAGASKESNVRWYSNVNTNFVDIQGPPTSDEGNSYKLILPELLSTVTPQTTGGRILEADASGNLDFIATPTSINVVANPVTGGASLTTITIGSTNYDVGAAGMTSWIADADSGGTQTIANGDTLDIVGGAGITTEIATAGGGPPTNYQTTVTLDNTAVSPGSYTNADITVDAQGRLTSANSGTSGVGGSGTAGRLPRWNTTQELDDSSIDETTPGFVEVIKAGGTSATDSVLYMDTTNRRVGFRTTSPGAAFDVNGSMRIRNEINVGHTSEQNLFVQGFTNAGGDPIAGNGYVKMGSYGQGNITGSPTSQGNTPNNLRRSAAFGRTGKVIDNYIYDTFEIKISALEGLGTTPLTGKVLVDTPSNLTCLLADFWFYRQINNNSAIGTWNDNTELVIYPSNDLSGQTIVSPYEQGYFRITNDFLSSTATGGKSGASCGLYQGNINGVDQGGMNGAWQIGDDSNNQPLGNKVYLSLATSGVPPTFPANSQTRFFIGLKYRFLSFQFGVVNNTDLITIEGSATEQCAEYTKCEDTSGEACNSMLSPVYIPVASASQDPAIIRNTASGFECCYYQTGEANIIPTPNHTVVGTFETCSQLPKACT